MKVPAREYISPSDLTFALSTCKRCLWIKYWHGIQPPTKFPLVGNLAAYQEEHFRNRTHSEIAPQLHPGKIKQWGQWVRSDFISIGGEKTRWKINGKYDLLGHNDDGTVALIDCKVSDSDRDSAAFYAPQLEAYAYAIEHPSSLKPFTVATMGLLVWKLDGQVWKSSEKIGFSTDQHYLPVERDSQRFTALITELIEMLESSMPESGQDCEQCKYFNARTSIL